MVLSLVEDTSMEHRRVSFRAITVRAVAGGASTTIPPTTVEVGLGAGRGGGFRVRRWEGCG